MIPNLLQKKRILQIQLTDLTSNCLYTDSLQLLFFNELLNPCHRPSENEDFGSFKKRTTAKVWETPYGCSFFKRKYSYDK